MKRFNFNNCSEESFMNIPYVRIPRELIYGEKYSGVSADAKFLFAVMLSRFSLSIKNKLTDKDGNVYIYFTCKDAMECVGCSQGKALKLFSELDCKTGVGLIEKKRQGLCKPDIIYINADAVFDKNDEEKADDGKTKEETHVACSGEYIDNQIEAPVQKKELQSFENKSPGTSEFEEPEPQNLNSNNINNNNIKNNKNKLNNHILPFSQYTDVNEWKDYKDIIKFNIGYDVLIEDRNKNIVDEIVDAMLNAICSTKEFITISGNNIPKEEVKRKFLAMDMTHIEYVCDAFEKTTTDIKNIHAYLLTALYRATSYINLHYQAMVKHDLKGERNKRMV